MQTFVPFTDSVHTARSLDRQRLGKQRVESQQILQTLVGDSSGWANHPAVKMWRGHERFLANYTIDVILEWRSRGYRDTRMPVIIALAERFPISSTTPPSWWGDVNVHGSHQASLLRKDRTHYQRVFHMDDEDVDLTLADFPGYVWPV